MKHQTNIFVYYKTYINERNTFVKNLKHYFLHQNLPIFLTISGKTDTHYISIKI